jgi:hypothetical protein
MKRALTFTAVSLLALLAGCDDDKKPATPAASATAATTATASAAVTAAPTATESAAPPKKIEMPPRPVPLGSSGPIQPSAPQQDQMMAITYTIAMTTPHPGDAMTVDKAYVDEISKKLEVAVRSADKGKTPPNPIVLERGNRKIRVEMGKGCTDKLPANLIAQRAGSSLKAAYDAGVLVVSCHDDKWECHQSTRDPADVLCHAAPRH